MTEAHTPFAALATWSPEAVLIDHQDLSSWYRTFADSLTDDSGRRPLLGVEDAHLLDSDVLVSWA